MAETWGRRCSLSPLMSVSVPIATACVRHAAKNFVRQLCLMSAFSFFFFGTVRSNK